jgi:single-strand DNA-binding protein
MLQKTDWHRVCVFKPYLRENVYKYMSKGQRVYVTGKVSYGEIKDEQGNTHVATSIIADEVIFITDSNRNPSSAAPSGGN